MSSLPHGNLPAKMNILNTFIIFFNLNNYERPKINALNPSKVSHLTQHIFHINDFLMMITVLCVFDSNIYLKKMRMFRKYISNDDLQP